MKKHKSLTMFFTVFISCFALFFSSAYIYIDRNLFKEEKGAISPESRVPYQKIPCDNTCLLLKFPDNTALTLYLDFSSTRIAAAVYDNYQNGDEKRLGYTADFKLTFTPEALSSVIDLFGGVELCLNQQNEKYRYTGIQIYELASTGKITPTIYREILVAVFENISKVGISKSDLVFLIENTDTALTVPDCYYWPQYLPELFKSAQIVN